MEEVQTIVALGAGSITKRVFGDGRIERCDNVKDVGLYIEKIEEMIERKRKLLSQSLYERENKKCHQVEEVPVPEALEAGAAVPEVEAAREAAAPEDTAARHIAVVRSIAVLQAEAP